MTREWRWLLGDASRSSIFAEDSKEPIARHSIGCIPTNYTVGTISSTDDHETRVPSNGHQLGSCELQKAWQIKLTQICIQLTWHSPPPTPLLPVFTLSAGEYRVSGGELKVSRQMGLPRNLGARRPKPKNGLPLFLAAFSRLL